MKTGAICDRTGPEGEEGSILRPRRNGQARDALVPRAPPRACISFSRDYVGQSAFARRQDGNGVRGTGHCNWESSPVPRTCIYFARAGPVRCQVWSRVKGPDSETGVPSTLHIPGSSAAPFGKGQRPNQQTHLRKKKAYICTMPVQQRRTSAPKTVCPKSGISHKRGPDTPVHGAPGRPCGPVYADGVRTASLPVETAPGTCQSTAHAEAAQLLNQLKMSEMTA